MRRLFTMGGLLLLGAVAFWQCNDDNEWDKPAIGSLGATEYKFTNAGGIKTLKFNTTVDWSATIKYADGATSTDWLTVSPTNGKAGAGEVKITVTPSDSYNNETAELIINAGGATKVYTITRNMLYQLAASTHEINNIKFEQTVIKVPVSHNVDYNITLIPSSASSWIKQVISKAEPVVDSLAFTILTYQTGLEPRTAAIVLSNEALRISDTVKISQDPGPTLTVEKLQNDIDGTEQEVEISLLCSMDWSIKADETYSWCRLTSEASGKRGSNTVTIKVDEDMTQARKATFTVKVDTMIRTIVINQKETGVENGNFIYKGNVEKYSAAALIMADEFYGFYTSPYKMSSERYNSYGGTVYSSGGWTANEPVYLHTILTDRVNSVKLSVSSDTWGGNAALIMSIYKWDTDVKTSIAGTALASYETSIGFKSHNELLGKDATIPAGNYMIVLEGSGSHGKTFGYWSWNGTADGSKFWTGARTGSISELLDHTPELYFNFDTKANGIPQIGFTKSANNGKTWSSVTAGAATLNSYLRDKQLKITDFNAFRFQSNYYGVYTVDSKVYVVRGTTVDGDWKIWNGTTWSSDISTAKSILTSNSSVSLVYKDNKVYLYTMDGMKVTVATATYSDTWPASLSSATTAYTFTEADAVTAVDVKYHSTGSFIATYVDNVRSIGTLTSTNGTTFTKGAALAPLTTYYMWEGAANVRYAANGMGVVNGTSQYISYSRTTGTQGIYCFPIK